MRGSSGQLRDVVLGGGGARNPSLVARIRHQLQLEFGRPIRVVTHEAIG